MKARKLNTLRNVSRRSSSSPAGREVEWAAMEQAMVPEERQTHRNLQAWMIHRAEKYAGAHFWVVFRVFWGVLDGVHGYMASVCVWCVFGCFRQPEARWEGQPWSAYLRVATSWRDPPEGGLASPTARTDRLAGSSVRHVLLWADQVTKLSRYITA